MAFREKDVQVWEALCTAIRAGDAALLECREVATGKTVRFLFSRRREARA